MWHCTDNGPSIRAARAGAETNQAETGDIDNKTQSWSANQVSVSRSRDQPGPIRRQETDWHQDTILITLGTHVPCSTPIFTTVQCYSVFSISYFWTKWRIFLGAMLTASSSALTQYSWKSSNLSREPLWAVTWRLLENRVWDWNEMKYSCAAVWPTAEAHWPSFKPLRAAN